MRSATPEVVNLSLEIQPKNLLICISLCLAVWVCLKQGYENMVLVVLLQIGAKDLTVPSPTSLFHLKTKVFSKIDDSVI